MELPTARWSGRRENARISSECNYVHDYCTGVCRVRAGAVDDSDVDSGHCDAGAGDSDASLRIDLVMAMTETMEITLTGRRALPMRC